MAAIDKVLDILETFLTSNKNELQLSEIAKITGFTLATTNRIALVLTKRGYLSQSKKREKYSLGVQLLNYSDKIEHKMKIADTVRPHLLNLKNNVNENVIFVKLHGHKLDFITELYSEHPLRVHHDPGLSTPLYCTAVGKMFLASMTKEELEWYLRSTKIEKMTPKTVTDIGVLKMRLASISQENVAYEYEELHLGINSIACGIKNTKGDIVYCVGIIGPSARLTSEKLIGMLPYLKNCAKEISSVLYYKEVSLVTEKASIS